MSHKEVLYSWFILITLAFVALLFLAEPLSTPTGYAVSLLVNPEISAEKVWDFSNTSDYTYNSSAISVNGTAQLVLITATTSTIIDEINQSLLVSATKYEDNDAEDKTSELNTTGNGKVQLNDGEVVLEIKLDRQLQNDDILSLYLLNGTEGNGKIYLCKNSSSCAAGVYGNRTLPGSVVEEWYNITLSGMSVSNNAFFIDSPDKIEIDMVKGYQKSTRTETATSTSYPSSSSIETSDFQPADWKRGDLLSKTEQPKGQTVNYLYSTDSGSSWTVVPSSLNLSLVTGSKIRFKVELNSNTTTTPIVDTLTLSYITQQPCTENWTAQYGSCLKIDTKLKYYTDVNACGTVSSLPADNNTYVSCDYCALFNCSGSAIQKPVAETKDNKTTYMVDAVSKTNTKLEIEAGAAPAGVEVVEYSYNIKNETPSAAAVNRYIDIQSDAAISSVKIILYYNDSEITALDENTLKIYYYNETGKRWDALPSTVNVTGNYVYATVPHLSLYGLFGEQPSSNSESSISTSGGSGGGRQKIETAAPISESLSSERTETVLPTRSEPESTVEFNVPVSETSCEYVVEMSLPDEIVLGEDGSYEGEVTNKGNCEIPELNLALSPELESRIDLPIFQFSGLQPGDKQKFILIRKKVQSEDLFSATSYVIGSLQKEKNAFGQVILKGYDETGEIFSRELPVSIIMKNSFPGKELAILGLIAVVLLIFAVRMWCGKEGNQKSFSRRKK